MPTPRIDRRSFLRASGVLSGLPFLEAMLPARAAETKKGDPARMVLVGQPLGMYGPNFFPTKPGKDYEPSRYMKLLQAHRDRFTVFSGMSHRYAAGHFAEQYLAGSRQLGDRAGICYSLADLGEIARLRGDLPAARMLLEDSIGAIPEGTDVYTVFEPDGAPTLFPANDHPSDKAAYALRITVPEGLEVAANGRLVETVPGDGTTTWVYDAPDPMATYLVKIAIADFELREATGPGGLPIRHAFDVDVPVPARARSRSISASDRPAPNAPILRKLRREMPSQ